MKKLLKVEKMNNEEVQNLVNIRTHIIECHNALDGKGVVGAMVKQENVAYEFNLLIKKIDEMLKDHVKFEK